MQLPTRSRAISLTAGTSFSHKTFSGEKLLAASRFQPAQTQGAGCDAVPIFSPALLNSVSPCPGSYVTALSMCRSISKRGDEQAPSATLRQHDTHNSAQEKRPHDNVFNGPLSDALVAPAWPPEP